MLMQVQMCCFTFWGIYMLWSLFLPVLAMHSFHRIVDPAIVRKEYTVTYL